MCSPQGTELELEYTCMCRWCAPSIERSPRWDGSTCTPAMAWLGGGLGTSNTGLRSRSKLLLSLIRKHERHRRAARCSVSAPLISLSGVTLDTAAASAPLSINAAALALRGLSCIGLSPLGMCTADRRVGCDARRRSCVGNTFDPRCFSRSRNLGRHRPLAARCLHR